jgi:hypothetical protein
MNGEAVHASDAQCKQAIGAIRPFRDNNGNISEDFIVAVATILNADKALMPEGDRFYPALTAARNGTAPMTRRISWKESQETTQQYV